MSRNDIDRIIRCRIFDLQAEVEELKELGLNHVLPSERIRELIYLLNLIKNERKQNQGQN